jgi:hypothetical protein
LSTSPRFTIAAFGNGREEHLRSVPRTHGAPGLRDANPTREEFPTVLREDVPDAGRFTSGARLRRTVSDLGETAAQKPRDKRNIGAANTLEGQSG